MISVMKTKQHFSSEDIKAFEPENKIGLLATKNKDGLPHLTLITTMQANSTDELVWGQFTEGFSKKNILSDPKTGFLIMTLNKSVWRGKSDWTQSRTEGEEYVRFNKLPMWRYNSYFGLHTIHYMRLVETTEKASLPVAGIVLSALLTKVSKSKALTKKEGRILNTWTEAFFNNLGTLKFLTYVSEDGYPVIIPLLQCQASDSHRLLFHPGVYSDELNSIKKGTNVAVFGLSLAMEDVLVRGKFTGFERHNAIKLGIIELSWVYNSMPPIPGQIYPPVEVNTVEDFG
jgi:nitroimidazol reductase NimA-like FMN-containing flavoprotein (pyridoxamine 5'-phosphate oxidase superfamily)